MIHKDRMSSVLKQIKLLITLLSIIMIFTACLSQNKKVLTLEEYRNYEFKVMGFSLDSNVKISKNNDTHDDWLGDGQTTTTYDLTKEQVEKISEQIKGSVNWSKVNNGQKIFIEEFVNLNNKDFIGFVFLKGSGTDKEYTKEELDLMKENGSIVFANYSYAFLDIDNNKLYYYQ